MLGTVSMFTCLKGLLGQWELRREKWKQEKETAAYVWPMQVMSSDGVMVRRTMSQQMERRLILPMLLQAESGWAV